MGILIDYILSSIVKVIRMKRKVPSIILLTVIFFLCLASRRAESQAWSFGKNKVQYTQFDWRVLTTPHFDVHFSEGYRELAARTGAMLEDGYRDLSRDFNHDIRWRIPVIIYGSHSAFQQTNTTWSLIPEGVQAFAEPNRRRVVLHFSGSNVDYRNTAVHELIHIFEFDIIYANLLRSVFSRSLLFNIPLWFAEGCSEYYSKGYDEEAEMFMRDAAVFDYLPSNLNYTGGYMVYKAGQSVVDYLVNTYGQGKVIDIMRRLKHTRSIEPALKETIGLTTEELTEKWAKNVRRRYWPMYSDKKEPEDHARRLTDHMEDHHYVNSKPEITESGEYIVYYSDRKGLDGIYLMNASTGKVEESLIQGSLSQEFESLRSMNSNLGISPDGRKIAFVAKSNGKDKMFISDISNGDVIDKIEIPLDFFFSPSWSPDGERIAFVGVRRGQTDIYLYDTVYKDFLKLTDDIEDEKDPSWFPGGGRIVYSRTKRIFPNPEYNEETEGDGRIAAEYFGTAPDQVSGDSDIWSVDLETGEKRIVIETEGEDIAPIIIGDGSEIVFSSNRNGIYNLYRGSVDYGSYYRFTDVLGGLFDPSYSNSKDRLVFSAFNSAGYDLFIIDSFSEKSRESFSTGGPAITASNPVSSTDSPVSRGGEEIAKAPQYVHSSEREPGLSGDRSVSVHINVEEPGKKAGEWPDSLPPYERVVIDEDSEVDVDPDTLRARRERKKEQLGKIQPYELNFSPDYVGNGMGLFYSTGFGFGLMNQIAFSDLLGDHHIYLSFNVHRSIEDSDVMLSYYYLRKRFDYAVGAFQFKNYFNSRATSLGEAFLDYRLFTERNYGVFGLISYPFSTFSRLDLEMQAYISEREFFESAGYYYYASTGEKTTRRLIQPTISLIHDSAYYGYFGPVIGSRWMISYSRSVSLSSSDLARSTAFYDYRKYIPLFYRNYLAFRTVGSVSTGDDFRYFFLGGPVTMRGYDYLQFQGSRMMLFNLEYRYPLVDAIVFGWPGRWAITNIGGTLFFDTGSIWGDDIYIDDGMPGGIDPVEINDLEFYSDFGVGFYMRMSFLILNFQLAWPTDFEDTGKPMFHFYIGPQF